MKIKVNTANDCSEFVRDCMMQTMRDSIRSMEQCGCSQAEIEALIHDTMDKIAEAQVDVVDQFNALTESFDAPKIH